MSSPQPPVIRLEQVSHRYGGTLAVDAVSLELPAQVRAGLIGPDGVGKSTLLGLIAGARAIQAGTVQVLGGDLADPAWRRAACPRIAYMPQGLGRNLYMDLSAFQNLDFFGRLFALPGGERRQRIDLLARATGLHPFLDRPTGKLSGGMKQKLGLCCALIHDPDLLLLDEPTTGVDPLSRRQFWQLIDRICLERPQMSVLVATAYMEEAEQLDWLIVMEAGRVLATGPPAQIKARHGVATLEQAYVALMPEARQGRPEEAAVPTHWEEAEPPVIVAEGLTCRFGDFTAVESVSFTISPGEIFGFLGSNGCGKTTTMKMLTGLLPATEGRAWLLGRPVEADAMAARRRVGYMSQAFSLYGELTVLQNLVLHGRLFQLNPDQIRVRLEALVGPFGLEGCLHQLPDQLPLGLRQRLSLAVALVHSPDLLILDEPTSGVDPVARDAFWDLLIRLSRRDRVTIFISTHFMNEAMRCDRISLMHAGSVLAQGTPAQLQTERGASSLEEAFIECIKEATGASVAAEAQVPFPARARDAAPPSRFSLSRLLAFSRREMQEVLRDPVRLGFAFIGSALLFVVFGFGINTDVDQVRFAVLDLDRTPQSRAYAAGYAGAGTLFKQQADLAGPGELEARMRDGAVTAALEIPPGFGRDLERGAGPQVSVWVDGANPWRAETIQTFLEGVHQHTMHQREPAAAVTLEPRFKYNPGLESTQSMVPEVMALLLVLIPSILMAVSVVREKELGSITNFQVTPATRFEFLLGKQLPYIGIGMLNFGMLALLAATVFKVPLKGNPLALAVGALLYIAATTGFGLLVSAVTSSQVAAVIATAIVSLLEGIQFSGMIQPVSTLQGAGRLMGELWPTTYFMRTSIGAYNKAMGFRGLSRDLALLGAFAVAFSLLSALALRKQER